MAKRTKEQRTGYIVRERSEGRLAHKLPFFCPRSSCKRITDTTDDKYLLEFGICAHCYITLVEGRNNPLIDIEAYRPRR